MTRHRVLSAAQPDPETGDDLVADEQRALGAAEIAHAREIAVARQDRPAIHHHRLHDHGGDLAGMTLEGGRERVEIVPARDHDIVEHACRHAGEPATGTGESAGPASLSGGRALI